MVTQILRHHFAEIHRRGDFSLILHQHRSRPGFTLDGLCDLNWDSVTPNVGVLFNGRRWAIFPSWRRYL